MKISKFGLFLVVLYALFTLFMRHYAANCIGMFCELEGLIPLWPWFIFAMEYPSIQNYSNSHGIFFYSTLFVLNSFIVYFIGVLILNLFKKIYFKIRST